MDQKSDKRTKIVLIVVALLILAAYIFIPKYLFAFSENSCDSLYSVNRVPFDYEALGENIHCKQMVKDGKTLFTFFSEKTAKDEICKSEDPPMHVPCYFRKALDTKNIEYCYNLYNPEICIINIAAIWKDITICNNIDPDKWLCSEIVQECIGESPDNSYCKPINVFTCDGQVWTDDANNARQNECIAKYNLTFYAPKYLQ
ncbi:hypothetical protein ACFL1B_03855 [Nanoarchaeota archaeon]